MVNHGGRTSCAETEEYFLLDSARSQSKTDSHATPREYVDAWHDNNARTTSHLPSLKCSKYTWIGHPSMEKRRRSVIFQIQNHDIYVEVIQLIPIKKVEISTLSNQMYFEQVYTRVRSTRGLFFAPLSALFTYDINKFLKCEFMGPSLLSYPPPPRKLSRVYYCKL